MLTVCSWPLNGFKFPMPGRIDPVHKVVTLGEAGLATAAGWDDELTFNTQASFLRAVSMLFLTT
jgi:hypothetical protein